MGKQVGEKIEYEGQKLTNIKKKDFFWPKKQAGAELKKKEKDFLGPKQGENLEIRSRNKMI